MTKKDYIKKDYMKLSKERLAELLVERDLRDIHTNYSTGIPLSCYNPNGVCLNPFHDCINCPRQWGSGGTITTTNIE